MGNTIIKVENISKSYVLKHQNKESYVALRDVISNKAKSILKPSKLFSKTTSEEFWALKDVSFEVKQGERVGIIGRNGAGKSTLLKVLSRIVAPTKGRITLDGRVASLLEVGTGFHPELTGRENVFLNGSILGMSKAEIQKKFDEIVAFSEVENFLDTPVKRYSSGMYVRLAFAVAAHLEPEILIVDEVLAVGDAEFQKKCLGKMQDVSSEGRTVIFVSHNMQAVQKLCNVGIFLNKGSLKSSGPIHEIVNQYLQSGESSQSFFTIPNLDENALGYAHHVIVEDMNGKPIPEVAVGDDWRIRILFKINKPTSHFILGLGIVSSFEQPIRTSWSVPQDIAVGEYEIIFNNNDLMLTTGVYRLVIGLSSHERPFQYVDNVANVCISEVGVDSVNKRIVNTQSGLILNPMQYTLTKLS